MKIIWSEFKSPYNERVVRNEVPEKSGIYLLYVNYKSGKWECFYVGKAEDLHSRLLDHLSGSESNKCIKENVKYLCGFYYALVSREEDRKGIEKYLYNYFKPECNQNDPGGFPIEVNLP